MQSFVTEEKLLVASGGALRVFSNPCWPSLGRGRGARHVIYRIPSGAVSPALACRHLWSYRPDAVSFMLTHPMSNGSSPSYKDLRKDLYLAVYAPIMPSEPDEKEAMFFVAEKEPSVLLLCNHGDYIKPCRDAMQRPRIVPKALTTGSAGRYLSTLPSPHPPCFVSRRPVIPRVARMFGKGVRLV